MHFDCFFNQIISEFVRENSYYANIVFPWFVSLSFRRSTGWLLCWICCCEIGFFVKNEIHVLIPGGHMVYYMHKRTAVCLFYIVKYIVHQYNIKKYDQENAWYFGKIHLPFAFFSSWQLSYDQIYLRRLQSGTSIQHFTFLAKSLKIHIISGSTVKKDKHLFVQIMLARILKSHRAVSMLADRGRNPRVPMNLFKLF